MTRPRNTWPLAIASVGLATIVACTLNAQERSERRAVADPAKGTSSIQDALLQPFHFPFAKPTPLDEVARHLSRALHAPVVVDRAAIERLGLKADDEVQLELDGVRLKTGLKLLLDQLDMTFKVVPEDNLLIFTDPKGSDDPSDRILVEMKALHRDFHDMQDALDEIRSSLGTDEDGGPKMRKPTIIEELAPRDATKGALPKDPSAPGSSPSRSRPGT
jgi:hypothetical protein